MNWIAQLQSFRGARSYSANLRCALAYLESPGLVLVDHPGMTV